MTEKVQISRGADFLLVKTPQTISPFAIDKFFSPLLVKARDAGVSKVLVDGRMARGNLSTIERFEYASWIAENYGDVKIAFVVHESLRDPHLFGQEVADNRGGNIRIFINLKEAYEWLEVNPNDA